MPSSVDLVIFKILDIMKEETMDENTQEQEQQDTVPEETWIEIDGERFQNEAAAHEAGYHECQQCGTWFNDGDGFEIDYMYFCDTICLSDYGYNQCDRCGEWHNGELSITVSNSWDTYIFCSSECARLDGCSVCTDCGDWTLEDRTYCDVHGNIICQGCRLDHYTRCEGCSELVHDDEAIYNEQADAWYCDDCESKESYPVHPYGYTPRLTFFGESVIHPYLGIELEIDEGDRYVCACELDEGYSDRLYMTEDGSLTDDGIELTSHPMTTEEHLAGWWEDVFDVVKKYHFTSHDNGRCGLHIHINRTFFSSKSAFRYLAGQKLTTLVDRFKSPLQIFTRRQDDHWCHYEDPKHYIDKYLNTSMIIKARNVIDDKSGHSLAVNFEHGDTFEIRIFRGTLRPETFYASIALVDGLARAVKSHGTTWCETVSWYEFLTWTLSTCDLELARTSLANYCYSKGLLEEHYCPTWQGPLQKEVTLCV